MASFEASLVEIVAPHLQPLGYEYDARLYAADDLVGFCKPVSGSQAIVQFQRRPRLPETFTVNLLRVNAEACGARLSTVLWYVYGLRVYPASDYWWPTSDATLRDAAEQVAQYGAPWIEDAGAARPWEMPAHDGQELAEAVKVNLAPVLLQRGYRLECQQFPGDMLYLYFVRDLPDGTRGFIELQSVYSLDPREFQFDVRVQRRADANPLAWSAQSGVSLAQLAWQARGREGQAATVAEAKALLWRYADRAELDKQLRDALAQIERVGLPWIDQASAWSK
jgi:hypothetical protein